MFNTLTSVAATALLLPWVIRAVGMETYGLWAVLGIFVGLTSLLDLGMWKSVVYLGAGRKFALPELLSTATLMCVAIALMFTLALLCLLWAGVPLFGAMIEQTPDLKWWLAGCGSVIVFTGLLTNLVRGALEAALYGHWVNVGYGVLTLLQYLVAVQIARYGGGGAALLAGSACVYVAILLLHLVLLKARSLAGWQAPSLAAMRAIGRYGLRALAADLPIILIGPALCYLFVLAAASAGEFGSFDLGLRIATLAATALGMLSTPFFVMVAGAGDTRQVEVRLLLGRQLRLMLVLAAAGWLLFLLAGPRLLALVFPERVAEVFRAALLMLAGTALLAAMEPVARLLMGLGRLRQLALTRALMLPVALASVYLLAQRPALDRFALAFALANVAGGLALWGLYLTERWGRKPASEGESCG
jgi:O-antigen/teichoic acid export membrane protein